MDPLDSSPLRTRFWLKGKRERGEIHRNSVEIVQRIHPTVTSEPIESGQPPMGALVLVPRGEPQGHNPDRAFPQWDAPSFNRSIPPAPSDLKPCPCPLGSVSLLYSL